MKSGSHQCGLTLLPVAGAELVGLERIEHAQDFLRVASHRQVGDVCKTDDALGIDDKRRPLRHAFCQIENTELLAQIAPHIGQHGKRKILQIAVVGAPRKVNKFGISASAENLSVALLKLLVEFAEAGDLGRTNKREILGPEE